MENGNSFKVYCRYVECRSKKIHYGEGKIYYTEETPQPMIFFNDFKVGGFTSYFNKDTAIVKGHHFQYYCPVCFAVKTVVLDKGQIVDLYENAFDQIEYDDKDEDEEESDE